MKFVRIVVAVVGILCICASGLTFIAVDRWWISAIKYAFLQVALLSVIVLPLSIYILDWRRTWTKIYMAVLVLTLGYQAYVLSPYLLPVPPAAPTRTEVDDARAFTLLSANVLMENEDVQSYLALVEMYDPDVALVIEPNERWNEALQPLRDRYEYTVEQPQENHYGMSLYSRLPLGETEVYYFERANTPSIRVALQLPSGDAVVLYGAHPRPPLPHTFVATADRELITIARRVQNAELPTVVAGDFNDVAWSSTMTRFQAISGLRELRIGRGIYNTFDAHSPIVHLPIDYIFITPGLGVVEFERSPAYSSDHFALYAKLVLDETVE